MTETRRHSPDEVVPMADWGQDHWSTLAYVETVTVEHGGFEMGADARMRSNRRNFRVMREACPEPTRLGAHPGMAVVMDGDTGSRLRDGTVVAGHDDWCCLQDMAVAGLFASTPAHGGGEARTLDQGDLEPGTWLSLSARGTALVGAVRAHKAAGGRFRDFVPPGSLADRATAVTSP